MKAMVMTKFGPPEVLQLREVAQPTPKDNEVLIKVHATTAFAGDCEMRGLRVPLALRLPIWIYMRFVRPQPIILGQELAGEIVAVGPAVQQFKVGDAVFGTTGFALGAYAQYASMAAAGGALGGALALKPANLSFAEAAAVPVGGLEALHFVRATQVQSGDRVLINGAGGSIGTMAIQLAQARGAEVTAVDSTAKLDMLRAIGAAHVIDYTQADFTRNGQTYDVIIDVVGKSSFSRSLRRLSDRGRYFVGNAGLSQTLRTRWTKTGSKQIILGTSSHKTSDLLLLKELIEAGQLKPVIDRTYSFEQLAAAHRYVDQGHKQGNVAITVALAA